jgi:tetratricopeptide (TPR) repeat protein
MSWRNLNLFLTAIAFSLLSVNDVIAASIILQHYQQDRENLLGEEIRLAQLREPQLSLEQPILEFQKFNSSLPSQLGSASSVIAQKIPNISIPSVPNINIPNIPSISTPSVPNINIPNIPSISTPSVPNINIPNIPSISTPSVPNINIPNIPSISTPSVPNINIPNIPSISTPSVPNINIPNIPSISTPSVPNINIPNIPSISTPSVPNINIPNRPSISTPSVPNINIPNRPSIRIPSVPDINLRQRRLLVHPIEQQCLQKQNPQCIRAEQVGSQNVTVIINAGIVHSQSGNTSQALEAYQKAINITKQPIEIETPEEILQRQIPYTKSILDLWKEHRFEEAFAQVEEAKTQAFRDQLQLAKVSVKIRNGTEQSELANQVQETYSQIAKLNQDLDRLSEIPNDQWKQYESILNEKEKTTSKKRDALQEKITSLLKKNKIETPEFASLFNGDVPVLTDLQNLLDNDTTLVQYYVTDEVTLCWIITKSNFYPVKLEISEAEIATAIDIFKRAKRLGAYKNCLASLLLRLSLTLELKQLASYHIM